MDVAARIAGIHWRRQTPVLQRALRGILRMATGKEPTAAQVRALAEQLEAHG